MHRVFENYKKQNREVTWFAHERGSYGYLWVEVEKGVTGNDKHAVYPSIFEFIEGLYGFHCDTVERDIRRLKDDKLKILDKVLGSSIHGLVLGIISYLSGMQTNKTISLIKKYYFERYKNIKCMGKLVRAVPGRAPPSHGAGTCGCHSVRTEL